MKEIVEEYSDAIKTAFIGIALIIILSIIPDGKGNVGIINILGYQMKVDADDMTSLSDDEITQVSVSHPAPTISYDDAGMASIISGVEINLLSYFVVSYYNSTTDSVVNTKANISGDYTFIINKISADDGTEITSSFNETTGNITFSSAGTYIIKVSIIDSFNQKTTCSFEIPVDIP